VLANTKVDVTSQAVSLIFCTGALIVAVVVNAADIFLSTTLTLKALVSFAVAVSVAIVIL
jgi:hypothetical protein